MKVTTYTKHRGKGDKIEFEVIDSPDNFKSIRAYLKGTEGEHLRTSAFLRSAGLMKLTLKHINE